MAGEASKATEETPKPLGRAGKVVNLAVRESDHILSRHIVRPHSASIVSETSVMWVRASSPSPSMIAFPIGL